MKPCPLRVGSDQPQCIRGCPWWRLSTAECSIVVIASALQRLAGCADKLEEPIEAVLLEISSALKHERGGLPST